MAATAFPTGIKLGGPAPAGEASDNKIYIYNSSGALVGTINLTPASAPTSALTTITCDNPSTPDYDFTGSVTSTSPFGLASADEFKTLLTVIKNLQIRVNGIVAALQSAGLMST